MAQATTKRRAQTGLEDKVLEDKELEGLLDNFFRADAEKKALNQEQKKCRRTIDAKIATWIDDEYRVGPYVITIKHPEERDIAFKVESKRQVRLKHPKS